MTHLGHFHHTSSLRTFKRLLKRTLPLTWWVTLYIPKNHSYGFWSFATDWPQIFGQNILLSSPSAWLIASPCRDHQDTMYSHSTPQFYGVGNWISGSLVSTFRPLLLFLLLLLYRGATIHCSTTPLHWYSRYRIFRPSDIRQCRHFQTYMLTDKVDLICCYSKSDNGDIAYIWRPKYPISTLLVKWSGWAVNGCATIKKEEKEEEKRSESGHQWATNSISTSVKLRSGVRVNSVLVISTGWSNYADGNFVQIF